MEVATALRKTETLIKRYGWKKKGFGNEAEGFCLIGALRHVIFGESVKFHTDDQWDVFFGSVAALHHVMIAGYPKEAKKSVAMWNDMDSRTEKQVLQLLRSAIAAVKTTP